MKKLAEKKPKLVEEERNLLSVAYKNVVGARRSAWRVVSSIEQRKSDSSTSPVEVDAAKDYRQTIEKELQTICNEVLVSTALCVCKLFFKTLEESFLLLF